MDDDNFEKDAERFLIDYGSSILVANDVYDYTKRLLAFQELREKGIRQLKTLLSLYEVEIKIKARNKEEE